jgi:hypothetical protein
MKSSAKMEILQIRPDPGEKFPLGNFLSGQYDGRKSALANFSRKPLLTRGPGKANHLESPISCNRRHIHHQRVFEIPEASKLIF